MSKKAKKATKAKEHKGLPVSGYQVQNDVTVGLVNVNRAVEENVLRMIDSFQKNVLFDPRWLAIGRTHIEQGFMAINRAISQPKRVKLPTDKE